MLDHYSGATRVVFIVGDPIAQVKSPHGVTAAMAARGADAIVVPAHVRPADLAAFFALAQRMPNVDGLIVTIPHKFAAAGLCAALSGAARSIGAANVVRRGPGGRGGGGRTGGSGAAERPDAGESAPAPWFGHMCDGDGYVAGLRRLGGDPRGRRALLVGAGGAGSAIAHALVDAGVAALSVHDHDAARTQALVARLRRYGPIEPRPGAADPAGFDLVINATPLGMREGDPLPVDVARMEPHAFVGCVVTRPAVPPLIAAARARGHATMTGADMFAAVCERMVDFFLEPAAPGVG